MRNFIDVHDAHCCKMHGCKYGDENCTVVNGYNIGIKCEFCEDNIPSVYHSSVRYKLSYSQRYAVDHLSEDIDFHSHKFDTLDEALEKYKYFKNKNTRKNYPRSNFKLIEYREIELDD